MRRVAIIITHPIQYYAPIFQLLTGRVKLRVKVFYTWEQSLQSKYDPGFGKYIQWDIPLLEGYEYSFVKNVAKEPGSHHFKGIINPTLNREIADWQADALLIFGWSYQSHLGAMRYFKNKIPVFFRGDSTLLDEKAGIRQFLRRTVLTWVYQNIDVALYVGTNNKQYYQKHGVKDNQLAFVPHAIDNHRFQANIEENKRKAFAWRRVLGIADDDPAFLFVGKLEPKKNPLILLEAFKRMGNTQSHLIFVGNGIMEPELKSLSSDKRIHFIDFQNQDRMPVVYHLGNVFVLPSQGPGETWGLAINEAMACGLPVLASNKVGCAVDLVKDGKNGYVFQSGDLQSLAEKMQLLLEDRAIEEKGKASLDFIEEWSVDVLCERLEEEVLRDR